MEKRLKINVIGGSGQMGRTHIPILEAAGYEVIISGRNSKLSLEQATINSDLTIVTVPIPFTEETIKRVAPHCKAIIDFTGVKTMPVNAMLKYSKDDCEVCGAHPLYGERTSIAGENIVFCRTDRTRNKCFSILSCFKEAGANLIETTPEYHDFYMNKVQNERGDFLMQYIEGLMSTGLSIKDIYKLSPPPTRVMLDLLARQVNEKNDELYAAMRRFNPSYKPIGRLIEPAKVREFYGEELEPAQERAKRIVEIK